MLDSTAENKERPQCGPFGKALQHADRGAGTRPSLDSLAGASKPLSAFEREWGERGARLSAGRLLGHSREFLVWFEALRAAGTRPPRHHGPASDQIRVLELHQNIRSAGPTVPKDPTFAIARLIRIWLSLRVLPIDSRRSSTLKPQQSVL